MAGSAAVDKSAGCGGKLKNYGACRRRMRTDLCVVSNDALSIPSHREATTWISKRIRQSYPAININVLNPYGKWSNPLWVQITP